MNLIDKIILEWSYRTEKGYPDINNKEDIQLFESLFGYNPVVSELVKLDYDVLTPEAKKIAEKIIEEFEISKEEIKPASKTHIVIYTKDRPSLLADFERSNNYGPNLLNKKGKFKVEGVTITLKPSGEKAGEFFELKPQQLGLTLDEKISLSTLQKELLDGINNNKVLNDIQKKALIYAVSGKGKISDEEKAELPKGFFNEVNKNFGEPHGALLYGLAIGADAVEFPAAGNYRLLDYILYKGEERIQVSAKSGTSVGNTVKYEDVLKIVDFLDGEVPSQIRKFTNIISSNSVYEGAFKAIEAFGSEDLKNRVKEYKKVYTHFPKLGKKPEDEQSHRDRIAIEKAFVKEMNNDPNLNFNDIFNNYVEVKYVKYFLNSNSLQGEHSVIDSGNFNVSHLSKNSPNHDSDKLGLKVSKAK